MQGNGGCGQFLTYLLLFPPWGGLLTFFPGFSVGSLSWEAVSTNFSNMNPSYRLQFFTNCFSVGPFHGVQSFRKGLLSCWCPTGPQVLTEKLLQHRFPTESQPPPLGMPLLWCGVLLTLQVDLCSTMDLCNIYTCYSPECVCPHVTSLTSRSSVHPYFLHGGPCL